MFTNILRVILSLIRYMHNCTFLQLHQTFKSLTAENNFIESCLRIFY